MKALLTFDNKAKTLGRLSKILKKAVVLPQIQFSSSQWIKNKKSILHEFQKRNWSKIPVIVRSSGASEDGLTSSRAGRYLSVGDVRGTDNLTNAVDRVRASYERVRPDDLIFIQPQLKNVAVSGVAFTRDPNTGSRYDVVNYDDASGLTNTVTNGTSNTLKTFYAARSRSVASIPKAIRAVFPLLEELEELFGHDSLDIEFAIDKKRTLYLLQIRPLTTRVRKSLPLQRQALILQNISQKIHELGKPHPYLYGNRAIFGVMPDWNPAEITGIRPRPLTLSLYKELITDSIWAYQRDNYGYKNLRSFPLLVQFSGCPYIDVRVSFNSFLPSDLGDDLSSRLVNHYLNSLLKNPAFHDKVEFEIVYSCYTLDLKDRLNRLLELGFNKHDLVLLASSLRSLTERIIDPVQGLWKKDLEKVSQLDKRRADIQASHINDIAKIYWLIEDCKRFGTLPFAGLARSGFIAVQNLNALQAIGIFSPEDRQLFLRSLQTVSSNICNDFGRLTPEDFLSLYGHLRPGTYDILSPRYDDDPPSFFDFKTRSLPERRTFSKFTLSQAKKSRLTNELRAQNMRITAEGFLDYIKQAIEAREYSKFIFTKNLSDVLKLLKKVGSSIGITTDDMSYANIGCVRDLYSSSLSATNMFKNSIRSGKQCFEETKQIILPPLITRPEDAFSFQILPGKPNFITSEKASGHVSFPSDKREKLKNSILIIPSADPGYDWIFSWGIKGFITLYGGGNSHMAIRAAEQGIPAVIGAGEVLFQRWKAAKILELDCLNQQVKVIE